MAFRDKECLRPTCHCSAQALLGAVASLVARFDGAFGAGWPTWAPGPRRGLRLPRSCRSPGNWRTGVSPHRTLACGDVGGRATDCAGSSVAAEWPDSEGGDGAPIPVRRLRLNLRNWVAVGQKPLAHGRTVEGARRPFVSQTTTIVLIQPLLKPMPRFLNWALALAKAAFASQPRKRKMFVVLTKIFMGGAADFARSR